MAETTPNRRQCFYVPFGQRDDSGYIPSLVTEGKFGHQPLTGNGPFASPWHWGQTYEEAMEICARENESRFGLLPVATAKIVASSILKRGKL